MISAHLATQIAHDFVFTLADHVGTSGPPWGSVAAAGWTRGGSLQDLNRFWILLGPGRFNVLPSTNQKFHFFELASRYFLY